MLNKMFRLDVYKITAQAELIGGLASFLGIAETMACH